MAAPLPGRLGKTDSLFWRDRPVFVTGGTGLVGSALVRELVRLGADVAVLVRDWVPQSDLVRSGALSRVKLVHGDVRDQTRLAEALSEYESATLFHLAAQTIVGVANTNPVATFEVNIAGTWSVLEAARHTPSLGQVVVASSDKAYGIKDRLPYDETMALEGCHPYDVSKSCADLIAQTYAHSYRLPVAITRCGNFFGGGDLNWSRLVPGTVRSVLRGEAPVLRSDGSFIRDYIYVGDAVSGYLTLAEAMAADPSLAGEAFNFSTEMQLSALEMVEKIIALMGSDLRPNILGTATNEIPHQYLSAAKARDRLGWHPAYGLDEGLRRTIDWYREFLND